MRVTKGAEPPGKGTASRVREAEQEREPGRVTNLAGHFPELREQPPAPMLVVSRDVCGLGSEFRALAKTKRPRQHAHTGGRLLLSR